MVSQRCFSSRRSRTAARVVHIFSRAKNREGSLLTPPLGQGLRTPAGKDPCLSAAASATGAEKPRERDADAPVAAAPKGSYRIVSFTPSPDGAHGKEGKTHMALVTVFFVSFYPRAYGGGEYGPGVTKHKTKQLETNKLSKHVRGGGESRQI